MTVTLSVAMEETLSAFARDYGLCGPQEAAEILILIEVRRIREAYPSRAEIPDVRVVTDADLAREKKRAWRRAYGAVKD